MKEYNIFEPSDIEYDVLMHLENWCRDRSQKLGALLRTEQPIIWDGATKHTRETMKALSKEYFIRAQEYAAQRLSLK